MIDMHVVKPACRRAMYCFTILLCALTGCLRHSSQPALPEKLLAFIASLKIDSIGNRAPAVKVEETEPGTFKVSITADLPDSIALDDWQLQITPAFTPRFHWASHLTPADTNIIAQHVFRSPAMIMADAARQFVIVPDLSLIRSKDGAKWYMDLNAVSNQMTLGLSQSAVGPHVLYHRVPGQVLAAGRFEFGFYVLTSTAAEDLNDPWRKPLAFLWSQWGKAGYDQGEPIKGTLRPYVKHTYDWAFDNWKDAVWQEFYIGSKRVGAPVFIVNVTQSPNYPGEVNEREFRSIWNQAWFSSLRSALGLYRWARRTKDTTLLQKAMLTKELALAFPQQDGLFNSVIATPMETKLVNGKPVNRSTGWKHFFFGNSNRNPAAAWQSAAKAPLHILDMSWTASLMLTWYEELEKDERLLDYAKRYADRLLKLQDSAGFFPAWLDNQTKNPLGVLDHSPESSLSATFLLKMSAITKDTAYATAALNTLAAVTQHIVPVGQWEDFETYWSCSRMLDSLVGKKITRNDQFKQNTLSIFWTAEALLNAYEYTGDSMYLQIGQRVLDELLMFQASWQPPFIAIHALGGFGVMNGDGEWNDSRQSLFAELIIRYGKLLNREEYVQRGIAAMKASFVMMYCPENPATRTQWEKVYPFFNEKDYGFMMENYGHEGRTDDQGLGIGEFTIYDWGNGAAAEAYNRITDHYPGLID